MTLGNPIGAVRARLLGSGAGSILLRGSAGALSVQVLGAGLALVAHLIVARALGAEGYGVYGLALTWVNVLSTFALIGQNTSVVRFVPMYLYRDEWGKMRGLLRGTGSIVLVASTLISTLVVIIVLLLQSQLSTPLITSLLAGALLLPILTQLQLNGAFHRGLKRAISAGIFNAVLRPTLLIGVVLVIIYGLDHQITAPSTMLLSAFAALIAYAVSACTLNRVWPSSARTVDVEYQFRSWLSVGSRLLLIAAIGITMRRVDVLLLGGLSGSTDVGPYFAAVQIAAVAAYGLTSVNTILAPMIAHHYAANEHRVLGHVVHRGAQLAFAVTLSASLALMLCGGWMLRLFGPQFADAYIPLMIILAGQCINAAMGPVGYVLTMTRFERQAPFIFGGGALLNLVFSFLFIPAFGMLGAAIATAVAIIGWNVAALVYVRLHFKINPTIFPLSTV